MGIAIAIVAVVALAVVGLVVTARSRATTGRLEPRDAQARRGRRRLDRGRGGRARRRVERGRGDRRGPRPGRRGPQGDRVGRLGGARAPRRRRPPAVYEPVDLDELGVTRRQFFNRSILAGSGLGLGAFGVAALAFLWPSAGGGFGGKVVVGSEADAKDAFDNKIPFYNAGGEDLHRRLPEGRPPQGEEGPRVHRADHRRDGSRATSRCTRSACTSAAACRGARARSGSSARATARSTTGSARSRVARRRAASTASRSTVSGGNIIVDTGLAGPRPAHRHQHHRPEPRGSALCLSAAVRDAVGAPLA